MNYDEVHKQVSSLKLPSFVEQARASAMGSSWHRKDYQIYVDLGRQPNLYDPGYMTRALTNNPMMLPKDDLELREQVATAIIHGVLHEVMEFISNGGVTFCDPHHFKGGSPKDTENWMQTLSDIQGVVHNYVKRMPAKSVC